MPVLGTCAGMILLAREVLDGRADQRSFGAIDIDRAPQRVRPPGRLVRGRSRRRRPARGTGPRRVHPGAGRRARSAPGSRSWPRSTRPSGGLPAGPVLVIVVPSGALPRPPGARAVPRAGSMTAPSVTLSSSVRRKGVPDVRPFQVGDDQAQEGRRRQGPRQALRQAHPPGRGRRPRGRRRPRHEPDAADDVPEGPRRVGADGHHRAGHQARHRRARGRHLRADHLRGLRPQRGGACSSTC